MKMVQGRQFWLTELHLLHIFISYPAFVATATKFSSRKREWCPPIRSTAAAGML